MVKPSTWDGRMTAVRALGLAALIFALVAVFAAPASAKTAVKCDTSLAAAISPGITPTPTVQTIVAQGGVSCAGAAQGKGTIGLSGSTNPPGDDCFVGAGSVSFVTSLLAPKNVGSLSGTVTFVRSGTTVTVTGGVVNVTKEQKTETLTQVSGTLKFIPTPGQDCISVAITSAAVSGSVLAHN